MSDDEKLKARLFEFLNSSDVLLEEHGFPVMTRDAAKRALQELIRPTIEVKDVCERKLAVVCSAPHVSYDGWTQYYCNRTAPALKIGRVIAKHFRDDNEFDIPAPIGRHVHVNRPTESNGPRGREHASERAKAAFELYAGALEKAGGKKLPLDLLIEFHGHRRHEGIEAATTGISESLAEEIHERYQHERAKFDSMPRLLIEPLHRIKFTAKAAKDIGSLHASITRAAIHIELPRTIRESETARDAGWTALFPVLDFLITRLET